ncbi:globin [Pseudothauera rhizosphaerae]|uniref:Globin n=2 Tax=Pseudothauera rhizosphaerae TaxID=2565932 RepID=A0A4S4AAL2_9RHOO|nr:group II truncated hemoglobin [Pseudothauera rhizosphaerae]THF55947.1 globin [Pseudothauera rhizosphaerae]
MQPDARTLPVLTPYEQIGGESAVRALVTRFYELMDALPETRDVRRMHAEDLSGAAEKLFLFLSGWFGGPNLYVERFGPPFLRARHLPFSIGAAERDQWMLCMSQALAEVVTDAELRAKLQQSFAALADHMRNRIEHAAPVRIQQPL